MVCIPLSDMVSWGKRKGGCSTQASIIAISARGAENHLGLDGDSGHPPRRAAAHSEPHPGLSLPGPEESILPRATSLTVS